MAEVKPTAKPTRSSGNSSRMIPKLSGRTPPPTPWTARAKSRRPIEFDSPAMIEPAASIPSAKTSMRSLPTLSPIRPMMGVKIEAESR